MTSVNWNNPDLVRQYGPLSFGMDLQSDFMFISGPTMIFPDLQVMSFETSYREYVLREHADFAHEINVSFAAWQDDQVKLKRSIRDHLIQQDGTGADQRVFVKSIVANFFIAESAKRVSKQRE